MRACFLVGWVLVLTALLSSDSATHAQKDKKPPAALADVKVVANLAYAPDGSFILLDYRTQGQPHQSNAALGIWDTKTGEFRIGMEKVPFGCDRIAISPDSKKVAAITLGNRSLKVWDAKTGKVLEEHTLPEWGGSIVSAPFLAFSKDGKHLYSTRERQILEAPLGGKFRLFGEKLDVIWSPFEVAFEPESKLLVVVRNTMGRQAGDLRVYDLAKAEKPGEPQVISTTDHIQSVTFSKDGKTLAMSYLGGGTKTARFELWDVPAFKLRTTFPVDTRKDFLNYQALTFAPGGKTLAGVPLFEKPTQKQNFLDILDTDGKFIKQVMDKNNRRILYLAYSPDGKTLAAVLLNHTLMFIDVATGEPKMP